MTGGVRPQSVNVTFRSSDDGSEFSVPWDLATSDLLSSAAPWRIFRWHYGQQHFSGTYWSSTNHGHVVYESRLELSRLLFADFDGSVRRILAQPFLMTAEVDGDIRRHVPDYLLLSSAGPIVVDVKPRSLLAKPKVAFTLAWTRQAVERRGWSYEVWSEPPEPELSNLRYLAGYRRDCLFDRGLLDQLRARDLDGVPLVEACECLPDWPNPIVRSAILHLLWTQHFAFDLTSPLHSSLTLDRRRRS